MPAQIDIKEVHWLLDIVQCIDVGVVVLDRQYRVEVWNSFMENHSGLGPDEVHGKVLFELFEEIDETWLRRKVDSVVQLGTRAFSLWEQRPYLVRFKNYQPITGEEDFMYQNVTLLPLMGASGSVEHLCVVIYDVTEVARYKKQVAALRAGDGGPA
ncbi:diguanylate cyclase [Pseudomonas tohonis]|uniref:Diguanylate cyclase n=1 Tax=Pseudomonas tohonis TaxID=2725477 RepID=A0A6J4E0I4_9PSED|nr:PAS domain-containing protein [Pseudomonas tohonis]BCG22869.1 diguanylate cyclase [Pseudomonas tohonis]GJN53444.1 diguanylate cyclase [Pseudomonas tohonis]